jgi:putative membrane protein
MRRDAFVLVVLGTLLATSAGVHVYHVVTGAQTFWISVTVLMTAFCIVSSVQLMGGRATSVFVGCGVTLGLAFEALSIATGFPFGPYHYTPLFGPGVLGVPFIIPLAWYVIVYLGYVIANLMIAQAPVVVGPMRQALFLSLMGAGVVTAYDLALDPFMVKKVGAWVMHNPGDYFDEQLRGFFGWTLVAFLIAILVRTTHLRMGVVPRTTRSTLAVAYPLLAYGMWWLFFSLEGFPRGTRVIAVYAMGLPTLAACSGLLAWRARQQVAPR